jgi:hypothetical protein
MSSKQSDEECSGRRAGGPCIFKVDKEDRRFKVCRYCSRSQYRTDKELADGATEVQYTGDS